MCSAWYCRRSEVENPKKFRKMSFCANFVTMPRPSRCQKLDLFTLDNNRDHLTKGKMSALNRPLLA